MVRKFNKRMEVYDLSSDDEIERQPKEGQQFEENCNYEAAVINSPGVSNIIAVKKEIPEGVEISENQEVKTDEEEVKITKEVIKKVAEVKKEEDGEIQIIKEVIRPKMKKAKRDEVQDVTPETICLDGAPQEIHRPIGYREAMKHLKTMNDRKKRRQEAGCILYKSKWYPQDYARKYCDWYERFMNPMLQTKLAPHLEHYLRLTNNRTEINQACSSQSSEDRIPTTDCNIQTEDTVETVAVDTAEKFNKDDEEMACEGNHTLSTAVSCENPQGIQNASGKENREEFQNSSGKENREEFQNTGENEPSLEEQALSQDLSTVDDEMELGDLDCTLLKMIKDTPATDMMQWVNYLLAENEQKVENENE